MFNGYPNPNWNYGGYQQQPQQMEKVASTLTSEEIERLRKKTSQFSITITQDEKLRGICNHRSEDGTSDTLVQDPVTGALRCTTCGYVFHQVSDDMTPEELKKATEQITDILQTIKLMYLDLPTEAAREYFQIIPLIDKIPQLFEFAAKNFSKHETYNWNLHNGNQNIFSMFQNLQNMFGGGMAPQPTYQPQGGMPYQQPQQPMMGNPAFQQGYSAPIGGNQFGYPGASNAYMNPPAYTPNTSGYVYQPEDTNTPAPTTVTPEAVDSKSDNVKI